MQGIKRTPAIPGTKLHENILYFCKKLKKHLVEKNIKLFSDFEIDNNVRKTLLQIDVFKTISMQLDIEDKQIYDLIVAYYDSNEIVRCFKLKVNVINSKILISSIPQRPTKAVRINKKKIPKELLNKLKHGSDGMPILTEEEMEEKLAECNEVVDVVYEKRDIE